MDWRNPTPAVGVAGVTVRPAEAGRVRREGACARPRSSSITSSQTERSHPWSSGPFRWLQQEMPFAARKAGRLGDGSRSPSEPVAAAAIEPPGAGPASIRQGQAPLFVTSRLTKTQRVTSTDRPSRSESRGRILALLREAGRPLEILAELIAGSGLSPGAVRVSRGEPDPAPGFSYVRCVLRTTAIPVGPAWPTRRHRLTPPTRRRPTASLLPCWAGSCSDQEAPSPLSRPASTRGRRLRAP